MRKSYLALIIVTTLAVVGCGAGEIAETAESVSGGGTPTQVTFEVTGPKRASSISYGVGADQAQDNGVKLPWTKTVTSTDALLIGVVTAQSGAGSGAITCKIKVDGKEVKTNKSSGEYAVVTCSTDGS